MGIKRNIVTEIVQRRDRSESRNYFGYSNKLDEINKVLEIETENEEFLKYIPVASIATLETFTRMIIKVIVDNGEPYLSNAIKLMREQFSFDIEYLIDLALVKLTFMVESILISIDSTSQIIRYSRL